MTSACMVVSPLSIIASNLRAAIESERFEEAEKLLISYSTCVADLLNRSDGDPEAPPKQDVVGLLEWALRMLIVARAHAVDQYQLLNGCRLYAGEAPDRKTFQIML